MKRERNVVHLFCEMHNSIHSNDDYDQMKTFRIVALFLFLCNKFECCGINLNDMEKMQVLRLTLVETHLEMFPKSTTMLEFEEEKKFCLGERDLASLHGWTELHLDMSHRANTERKCHFAIMLH